MRLTQPPQADASVLAKWETIPLWGIGLSNGLNISLWYALSFISLDQPGLNMRMPLVVSEWMPTVLVLGGLATAIALDGALVATIMGIRLGRKSIWSVLTIVGAGAFSAAIAYAVHSKSMEQWSGLHMAQAAVLVLYLLHLSQPRNVLQADKKHPSSLPKGTKADLGHNILTEGFTCKRCGTSGFETLAKVQSHQKSGECVTPVFASTDGLSQRSTNGVNH